MSIPLSFVCANTDGDSLNEVIAATGTIYPSDPLRLVFWECRSWNRYSLVRVDTGGYPFQPGIDIGNLYPFDAGDVDGDGLTDIVGTVVDCVGDSWFNTAVVLESPCPDSHPSILKWRLRYSRNQSPYKFFAFADLDRDGRRDLFMPGPDVFEARGNDSLVLAWEANPWVHGCSWAFGDFDRDSLTEFAAGFSTAHVLENAIIRQDTYHLVGVESTGMSNGNDVFSGNDVDQDGRPEFFIAYWRYATMTTYLWMWEATAHNTYVHLQVDQVTHSGVEWDCASGCGDLDGDGTEEIVWASTGLLAVYRATGNNQFTREWAWSPDHGGSGSMGIRFHDMNHNGYNDMVVSGNLKTSIFEVEAIRVMSPNGGELLEPGQVRVIRWRILTPPRCDSVSLFLRTDSAYQLDTIAHGLSPFDSTYGWTVPDTTLDSCRILAIAYGPGWQYDESDSAFAIGPVGVAAPKLLAPRDWSLSVSPNPAGTRAVVRYDVPVASEVRLSLFDASGRKVTELAAGTHAPGRYSLPLGGLGHDPKSPDGFRSCPAAGIYFLRLEADGQRLVRKLVVQ